MARLSWLAPLLLLSSLSGQDPGSDQTRDESPQSEERDVSINPKKFAANFFSDQKMIWTFPAKVVTGSHWIPTVAILGGTAGLVALDPAEGRFFRRHGGSFQGLNDTFSESHTTATTLLTPAAFYAAGLIRRDKYLQQTGLLAAEAWVNVDLLSEALRDAT